MSLIIAALLSIGMPLPPSPMEIAVAEIMASEGFAVATEPAVRTGNTVQLEPTLPPPPPVQEDIGFTSDSANGRCVGAEGLLASLSPGWNVTRMAGIMYRESRCMAGASNSCCSGLLQIHRLWVPQPSCDVHSRSDLYDPVKNVCVGAIVWQESGYGAWSTA